MSYAQDALAGVLDFLCPSWDRPREEKWSSGPILTQERAVKQAPIRHALLRSPLSPTFDDDDAIARAVVEGTLKIHRTAQSRF